MKSLKVFHYMLVPQKIILILCIFSLTSSIENKLLSQQTKNTIVNSTSLMGQLFGPESLGVHINQNLEKRFSLNIGLGIGLDAHIGFNVYLTNRDIKRLAWYVGTQVYLVHEVSFISGNFWSGTESSENAKRDSQIGVYIPIGLEFISKNGFTLQFDLGPNFLKNDWEQINTAPVMGSLKIGYTFRSKPK